MSGTTGPKGFLFVCFLFFNHSSTPSHTHTILVTDAPNERASQPPQDLVLCVSKGEQEALEATELEPMKTNRNL